MKSHYDFSAARLDHAPRELVVAFFNGRKVEPQQCGKYSSLDLKQIVSKSSHRNVWLTGTEQDWLDHIVHHKHKVA